MNNSFIVIDDPQSEPPKTEKEIIDGKFHLSPCVAMILLSYTGESRYKLYRLIRISDEPNFWSTGDSA